MSKKTTKSEFVPPIFSNLFPIVFYFFFSIFLQFSCQFSPIVYIPIFFQIFKSFQFCLRHFVCDSTYARTVHCVHFFTWECFWILKCFKAISNYIIVSSKYFFQQQQHFQKEKKYFQQGSIKGTLLFCCLIKFVFVLLFHNCIFSWPASM
jgi:hypothetical protein